MRVGFLWISGRFRLQQVQYRSTVLTNQYEYCNYSYGNRPHKISLVRYNHLFSP